MSKDKLLDKKEISSKYEEWLAIDDETGNKDEINKKKRIRGYALEKLLYSVLYYEKMEPNASYVGKGEQIDGAFFYGTNPFLLEAKWHKEPKEASQIYSFKGKVDGKFHITSGVFISMSGYSEDCVDALRYGKTQNIILFDGSDMDIIFKQQVTFETVLRAKLKIACQKGEIYVPYVLEKQIASAVEVMQTTKSDIPSSEKTLMVITSDQSLHKFLLPELKKLSVTEKLNIKELVYVTNEHPNDYLSGIERTISVIHSKENFDAALILLNTSQQLNPIELGEVNKRLYEMNIPVRIAAIQLNKEHPSFEGTIKENVKNFLERIVNPNTL